ncbi:hypothetical protein ABTX15_28590 [Micromonospora sp. NPDC094482]
MSTVRRARPAGPTWPPRIAGLRDPQGALVNVIALARAAAG